MAKFGTIGHIALYVKDLARAVEFYERLGLREFLRLDQEPGVPWIAYLRVTDDLYIELFPTGEDRPVGKARAGLNHLCLLTENIERTVSELAAAGISPDARFDPARIGVDNNRGFFVTDPDDNRIEIMEMGRNAIQSEAIERFRSAKVPQILLKPRLAPAS
ncbi:MAG TPA: VOC family protein [Devosia sp.]|nr:VOC family protein [Devosia sp.]